MPWYRRNHRAWGSYFFTPVTQDRYPLFRNSAARRLVREAMRATLADHPMAIHKMVLLPDHLHILCGVPDEGQDYQLRIQQNRTCITSYARSRCTVAVIRNRMPRCRGIAETIVRGVRTSSRL